MSNNNLRLLRKSLRRRYEKYNITCGKVNKSKAYIDLIKGHYHSPIHEITTICTQCGIEFTCEVYKIIFPIKDVPGLTAMLLVS